MEMNTRNCYFLGEQVRGMDQLEATLQRRQIVHERRQTEAWGEHILWRPQILRLGEQAALAVGVHHPPMGHPEYERCPDSVLVGAALTTPLGRGPLDKPDAGPVDPDTIEADHHAEIKMVAAALRDSFWSEAGLFNLHRLVRPILGDLPVALEKAGNVRQLDSELPL